MGELLAVWKAKFTDTGRNRWLIILLLGLLLIVIVLPVSSDSETEVEGNDYLWEKKEDKMTEKTLLEQKLTELLESVKGVGKVQVMIMTGEEDTEDFYTSRIETVTGVLISAEGADSPVTVKNIQEAVMALFQVDAHKIKVMKMK